MAFLAPLFTGFATAGASGAGIMSSLSAAGSLIGTGTAAGVMSGIGMGVGAVMPSLMTLGTLTAAGSAMGQARSVEEASRYNAGMAIREAEMRESMIRREGGRRLGTIRAQIGKSGATGQGTPLMVLAESAANAEIDALNTRTTGQLQAGVYRAQGANARTQGNLMAGAQLLKGFGQIV